LCVERLTAAIDFELLTAALRVEQVVSDIKAKD
jgi:hypothetical protein